MKVNSAFKQTYKIGDQVTIGAVIGGCGFPVGYTVTVIGSQAKTTATQKLTHGDYFMSCNHPSYGTYSVYDKGIAHKPRTKGDIKEEIKDLEARVLDLKGRMTFMDEIGSESYDENEYKAYNTLSIIEAKGTTKAEKAKLIAKLISEY